MKTKYSIGQRVYLMNDNMVCDGVVIRIIIDAKKVRYQLRLMEGQEEFTRDRDEVLVFEDKKSLIESL